MYVGVDIYIYIYTHSKLKTSFLCNFIVINFIIMCYVTLVFLINYYYKNTLVLNYFRTYILKKSLICILLFKPISVYDIF